MPRESIDEILAKGRGRQKRLELGLGVLLLVGGIVVKLALPGARLPGFGAIGLGAVLIALGLFGSGRGD